MTNILGITENEFMGRIRSFVTCSTRLVSIWLGNEHIRGRCGLSLVIRAIGSSKSILVCVFKESMIHTQPIEMLPLAETIIVPNCNFLSLILVTINLYLILVCSSRIDIHHFVLGEELPSLKIKLLWISTWVVHAFLNHSGQNRIIYRCASHLNDFISSFVDLGIWNKVGTKLVGIDLWEILDSANSLFEAKDTSCHERLEVGTFIIVWSVDVVTIIDGIT